MITNSPFLQLDWVKIEILLEGYAIEELPM